MTPKENFMAYFHNEAYEWIPSSFDLQRFNSAEIGDNKARGLVHQQNPISRDEFGGKGLFDVEWKFVPEVNGSIDVGRTFDDIADWKEKVHFTPLESFDWEGVAERNKDWLSTDKVIMATMFSGYFERLISFTDFEDAALYMIDEDSKEDVKALFNALTDYYIEYIGYMKKYFHIDMLEFHDDWGSQTSLLMSKDTHREMIMPYVKRIVDACHEQGILYMQHSCGFVEDLIPHMIECGVDTWVGQNCCDKKKLVKLYGDKLHFGVMINPSPMPERPAEQIIEEVKNQIEEYKGMGVWYNFFAKPLGEEKCKSLTEYCENYFLNNR